MHLDLVALADHAREPQTRDLVQAASGLAAREDVICAGVIEAEAGSDFDLAFFFVLSDFSALEPFGTDERYSRFLQRHLAPVLRQLAGADVRLAAWPDAAASHASCLALAADDETYDWEVNEELESWAAALGGASAIGLAVGERQRYRGAAIVFADPAPQQEREFEARFAADVVSGPIRKLR
jgi:hypothetical protein